MNKEVIQEPDQEEPDEEFLTFMVMIASNILVKRLGGRVVISRKEFEEARSTALKAQMDNENLTLSIVSNNSQESNDVH